MEPTLEELRTWSIVHTGTRSYIGLEEPGRPTYRGIVLLNAFEYHVHRAVDPQRGGVQIMVMVLPAETLGPLEVRINDTAATVVKLYDAPESTLRVLHSRVCMAFCPSSREVPAGGQRIVLPGVPMAGQ